MSTELPQAAATQKSAKRRGVVLVAVLVVVILLSLAGYQYSNMSLAEYKAAENAHRQAQARAFAESGVHYAAALLSSYDNFVDILGGNPWNNPKFKDQEVLGENDVVGRFSIIAPADPEDGAGERLYGVTCEAGRINLNALMKQDPTGERAFAVLMKLPDMTEEIANAIIDWMDPDSDSRTGGAENSYYLGLSPPYRCKNGPLDSIDELLLVRDVTPELLHGSDANRNGNADSTEGGGAGFTRGWASYLTVHSREPNRDQEGNPYVFLNNLDLKQLTTMLTESGLSDNVVKFVIMARQYPQASTSGGAQSLGSALAALFGASSGSTTTTIVEGKLDTFQLKFDKKARYNIASIFELVNSRVSISKRDGRKTINTVYSLEPSLQLELMQKLFAIATLEDPATTQELAARINVNTAPREVLLAMPELTEADVEKIMTTRPRLSAGEMDEIFLTPTWLMTDAQLGAATLKNIEKYITTRSQVYRVQSVGYFPGKGPAIRVEAVIDTNSGRPRIIAWRDLSELGRGIE